MSIAAGVARFGQRQAEALMTSTCAITHSVPATPAVDPETGLENDPVVTTTYSGPCRLRFPYVRPEQALPEGQQLGKERGILSLPVSGSDAVGVNDIVTITGNPLDPDSVGTQLRIMGPFMETYATARRFPAEVVA